MRTFLDTNILSALWMNEASAPLIRSVLAEASRRGSSAISVITHAECHACPGASEEFIRGFLETVRIDVDTVLPDETWSLARDRYARYVDRRRHSGKGMPRRILADFLIGAHAQLRADRLMTMDVGFFARNYPDLRLYPIEE